MTTEPPSKIWVYGTGVTDFSYRGWDVQSLDPSEVYYRIPDELVERFRVEAEAHKTRSGNTSPADDLLAIIAGD